MFYSTLLNIENSIFGYLKNSFEYEMITKGRHGANLVYVSENKIHLVRTTTKYQKPAQIYNDNKYILEIIRQIKLFQKIDVDFNSALIEIYNNDYKTMGFHSDQALDLVDDSFIAIFSCYNNPDTKNKRSLVIQDKESMQISTIKLAHNSVLLFSTDTNKKNLHKIILEQYNEENTEWLGVTFRFSKTLIEFKHGGIPYFENGSPFTLCDEKQRKEFYKNKSLENKTIYFSYSPIYYTISQSDLLEPVKFRSMQENKLLVQKNLMIYDNINESSELTFLLENFCGRVIYYENVVKETDILVYIVGNVSKIFDFIQDKCQNCRLYAVNPFCYNNVTEVCVVKHGFVPINIFNLGIYFRELFSQSTDQLFSELCLQHRFSDLTESNKPTNAYRKGVYLSNVRQNLDKLEFNLLRCSTNFQFPTENFRGIDHEIIRTLNDICKYYFEKPFDFNHVLAQIYENKLVENRSKKARISAHSDKTKENASLIEEIKEWTLEKIREEREKEYEYKEQIIELKEQLTNHKLEIAQLKNEILDMKTKIADVYTKMQGLKPEIYSELKSELANELASQFQSEINSKLSCNSSLITFGNQLIESVTVNKVNESTCCNEVNESTCCNEGISNGNESENNDCPTFIKELIHDTKVLSFSTGIYTKDHTQLMSYIASIIIFKKDGIKIIECGPEISQKRPSSDYYCKARYYYWNAYDYETVNGTSIIKQTIKMNWNMEHIAYYDDDKTTLIAEYKKDQIKPSSACLPKDYSKTYLKVYGHKDTIYECINIESFNYIYCPKSIGLSLTHPKYIKYPRGTKIYYYYNTGHAEHSGLIYFYDGCALRITDMYQCNPNISKSRVKYDKYTYNIQYFDEKNVLDCEYIHKSQTLQFYSNGSPIYETKTKNYEFVYIRFPE